GGGGLSVGVISAAVLCGSASLAQPATTAQNAPQTTKKKNACAFVPLSLIEGFVKYKLSLFHDIQEENMSVCEVIATRPKSPDAGMTGQSVSGSSNLDADSVTLVTVKVYWAGGKEVARMNQAEMSMAKQMMNDKDVNIEELTGSGKVRGLADKAFYSDVLPSWFLKGD